MRSLNLVISLKFCKKPIIGQYCIDYESLYQVQKSCPGWHLLRNAANVHCCKGTVAVIHQTESWIFSMFANLALTVGIHNAYKI